METRREIDWRHDLRDCQLDTGNDCWPPHWKRLWGDWREVPVSFLRGEGGPGGQRLYVVQTCQWYEREEDGWWYPEDGAALLALADFAEAKRHARRHQPILRERLGVVEALCDGTPGDEAYLLKAPGRLRHRTPDFGEGEIVAAFTDRFEAEQDAVARAREDWRRACEDQTTYLVWDQWTSLPPERLPDLCAELRLPQPRWLDPKESWHQAVWAWWQQTAPLMDGWQRERLRLAMDRFSAYQVVAVPYSP
jgi:hypothetical protein